MARKPIQSWSLILLAGLVWGCETNYVKTTTLVCTPGERICDESLTKVLECHPNGAAWTIASYCIGGGFCSDNACVGESTPVSSTETPLPDAGSGTDNPFASEDAFSTEDASLDSSAPAEPEDSIEGEESPGELPTEEEGEGGESPPKRRKRRARKREFREPLGKRRGGGRRTRGRTRRTEGKEKSPKKKTPVERQKKRPRRPSPPKRRDKSSLRNGTARMPRRSQPESMHPGKPTTAPTTGPSPEAPCDPR